MTPDPSDIARRLRQTRADMLGTADEDHYWDCHAAADEIERLRLTDAEREAIEQAIDAADGMAPAEPWAIATLRGLLGRMSENGDCLAPDNATIRDNPDSSQPIAKCDATPPADATPEECSVLPQTAIPSGIKNTERGKSRGSAVRFRRKQYRTGSPRASQVKPVA